ncbi:peroxiredoxin [Nocardiopsis kunsanensis]|uniref:Peroxiredoxin n=1 Tax=Nocardiopsis kunsanensis TaxID=141693 RepID=A0A918XEH2_9ACTN|nr:peroxiredoxin [Nocardiopsis kunsanensis]GHD28493.1 peroxiredoxin [Nocardiopsis kunsanensis]
MTNTAAGARAPDFTLDDQHGRPVTLSALRGGPVLVVFYPLAFSGVCSGELTELAGLYPRFAEVGVHVLAVSVDSTFALRTWSDREGFPFRLLSDFWPHGAVAEAYGVFDDRRGVARRGTFLLDTGGVVRWSDHTPVSEPREMGRALEQARSLV